MTLYDAAMIGVIVAGMVWGAVRGITWQLASIASLVLGYTVAQPLSGQLAPQFPGEPVVARSLAMLTVYFAVSCGTFFAAWLVRATLRRLKFEAFDRHLGMVLGGMEGALLGLVVTLFVVSLAPQTRVPIFSSPTGRVAGQVMTAVGPILPEEARGVLAPFFSGSGGEVAAAPEPELTPAPAPEPPSPARSIFRRDRQRERGPGTLDRAAATTSLRETLEREKAAATTSLRETLEREEERLGKAIADQAIQGIRRATGRGEQTNGRTAVERR
jgi:membrane protein required for colicin V production